MTPKQAANTAPRSRSRSPLPPAPAPAPAPATTVTAKVLAVHARVEDQWLRVEATVRDAQGKEWSALVPDRELATILPRSILAADATAPVTLLDTIVGILERVVVGRHVRLWQYRQRYYLRFLSWRSVRFRN